MVFFLLVDEDAEKPPVAVITCLRAVEVFCCKMSVFRLMPRLFDMAQVFGGWRKLFRDL